MYIHASLKRSSRLFLVLGIARESLVLHTRLGLYTPSNLIGQRHVAMQYFVVVCRVVRSVRFFLWARPCWALCWQHTCDTYIRIMYTYIYVNIYKYIVIYTYVHGWASPMLGPLLAAYIYVLCIHIYIHICIHNTYIYVPLLPVRIYTCYVYIYVIHTYM